MSSARIRPSDIGDATPNYHWVIVGALPEGTPLIIDKRKV